MRGIFVVFLLLTGCSVPSIELFQERIPTPELYSEKQLESWRQASSYLSVHSNERDVATALSASIGLPERLELDNKESIIQGLADANEEILARRSEINEWLAMHSGKEVEGTGIDLTGFSLGSSFILIVALCVFVPGFASVFFFLLRRVGSTTKSLVYGIERFIQENPTSAERLKESLSMKMDKSHKRTVAKIKGSMNG